MISVEVVYARPGMQFLQRVALSPGETVHAAIRRSGLLEQEPDIDLEQAGVGIFGKPCALDAPVYDGARIEVYRPLLIDPKALRRKRAAVVSKRRAQRHGFKV